MAALSLGRDEAYKQFIAELQANGIKTTRIHEGKEADFFDYGNALSDELKQTLLGSFDCEQDYKLQAEIATLFQSTNYIHRTDFVKALKSMGYEVSVTHIKSDYISDWKGGNFDNSEGRASIGVYTISDGMGGEIKIADCNGNGALETEELFMNQILGDINVDLSGMADAPKANYTKGGGKDGGNSILEDKANVTQDEYNKLVEEYINDGLSESMAKSRADAKLGVDNMSYTGNAKPPVEEKEETPTTVIEQNDFNKEVERYLELGYSEASAIEAANINLGSTDMEYTGNIKKNKIDEGSLINITG